MDILGDRMKAAAEKQFEKIRISAPSQLLHNAKQKGLADLAKPLILMERVAGLEPARNVNGSYDKSKG